MSQRILVLEGLDDSGRCEVRRQPDGELRLISNVTAGFADVLAECGTLLRVLLGVRGSTDVHIPHAELIVNTISDADAARVALVQAHETVEALDVPVINAPLAVARTRRDQLPGLVEGYPGLYAPQAQRVQPERLDDIARAWRSGTLPADFLIRPADSSSHGGEALYRVQAEDDLDQLERYAFDGRRYLIAPFVDYCSPDGYFRKYRLAVIDGEIHPRHAIASPHWMIHSESRREVMHADVDLQEQEQRFLAAPNEVLGPTAWPALEDFARSLPLEYCGMDLGLLADGRAVVFECNASMNLLGSGAGAGVDYLQPPVDAIRAAIVRMAERRLE